MSQPAPPAPGTPTDDATRLRGLVDTWRAAVDDLVAVLQALPADAWGTPTDLPGWTVHDVAAHCAHLEAVLAGGGEDLDVEVGDLPHVRGPLGRYTEQGVIARRDRTPEQLIAELAESADARYAMLASTPPTDASQRAYPLFAGVDWDWGTLLGNRVVDVWVHEQDIRRAAGVRGGFDSPAARHTLAVMTGSLPPIVARRAAAPPGSSVVISLDRAPGRSGVGDAPVTVVVSVDDTGRGRLGGPAPANPTARLVTDVETFACASGGRRRPDVIEGDAAPGPGTVAVRGDVALGERIVAALSIMP